MPLDGFVWKNCLEIFGWLVANKMLCELSLKYGVNNKGLDVDITMRNSG